MLEYILLIGIVLLALTFMGTDIKRGIQSIIRVTADQIGNQANSDQDYGGSHGYMINSVTKYSESLQHTRKDVKGVIGLEVNDVTSAETTTYTNQGVTPAS